MRLLSSLAREDSNIAVLGIHMKNDRVAVLMARFPEQVSCVTHKGDFCLAAVTGAYGFIPLRH